MAQQTAVEWLFMTLALTPMTDWYNVLEQAKAMEKDQMLDAYNSDRYPWSKQDALKYYTETFNK